MISPYKLHEEYKDDWTKTKEILISLYKDGYNFRGHNDYNWEINSSFERNHPEIGTLSYQFVDYYINAFNHMTTCGLFNDDYDSIEITTIFGEYFSLYKCDLSIFIKNKYPETSFVDIPQDIINNFIKKSSTCEHIIWKMQHHGIYTHLIDITRSPYIAAYFALFNSLNKKNNDIDYFPAIIAINEFYDYSKNGMPLVNYLHKKRKHKQLIHERINRQQSSFINSLSNRNYEVYKFKINPDWIKDIYIDLQLMNINGYSLFGTKEMASLDYYYSIKHGNVL